MSQDAIQHIVDVLLDFEPEVGARLTRREVANRVRETVDEIKHEARSRESCQTKVHWN